MDFAFSLFLYFFILYYVRFVVVGKILLHEWKMPLNELAYISLAGFTLIIFRVVAIIIRYMLGLAETDAILTVYLFSMPILFLFFYTIKAIPVKQSLLLTFLTSMLPMAFIDIVLYSLGVLELPHYGVIHFTTRSFWHSIITPFASSVLVALLIERIFRKLWSIAERNHFLQNVFLFIAIGIAFFIGVLRLLTSSISYGDSIDILVVINFLMVLPFIVAVFVYSQASKESLNSKRESVERKNMQNHLRELEQQFSSIRKFKHDYQNILTSMENFFLEKDLSGLEQYFFNKVKPTFETVTTDNFVFEALRKIQIPEIKSLISAKIIMAQNISTDVETSFESCEDIQSVSVDSITLVRMLGIILDNAIEELEALRKGKLAIACFKDKGSVVFVVQNTCRPDIPTLQMLKESGFTTKDGNSGLGLSILEELQVSYPNISLSTMIENDTFTQKLTIANAENFNF